MERVTVVLPLMMVLLGYTGLETENNYPDNNLLNDEEQSMNNLSQNKDYLSPTNCK